MIAVWADLRRRKLHKRRIKSGNPERTARISGLVAIVYIMLIIAAHTLAMVYFEGFDYGDSVWLTLTSLTTVGYGDISAATTMGRLSTILILYIGGIFIVGKMAGDYFDYQSLRRDAMKNGSWSWCRMQDHIIIIGSKRDSELHLSRLITECEKTDATKGRSVILISESFDGILPETLHEFDIKYVKGRGNSPDVLEKAGVQNSAIVVILAWEEEDQISDGYAFDVICRIRETGCSAKIVAECVNDDNRQRLTNAGATLVLRPIRAYPEMIVGGLINPGSTDILENLFTATGERIVRTEGDLSGSWADIVSNHVGQDLGTPVAYRDAKSGKIITAPPGSTAISANALFVLGG